MGYYALCPILGANMLKYKNKKLIFRIILLVLMDMLIITAAACKKIGVCNFTVLF